MDFYQILDQVIDLLRQRGRVTYRALKIQYNLDENHLAALKEELIDAQRVAVEEYGSILVWVGESGKTPESPTVMTPTEPQLALQEAQRPQGASPRADPSPRAAERRQLTVLFCDLVGSTALSGQLDPEELRDIVRAYQAVCAAVVQRFDGYIAQYLGDALLIYFGYPQAHEDDAQRAVHAGLGMLAAMSTLNARLAQEKSIRLAIRVGMHTGVVVVGEMGAGGRHEQLALGETPNVAARIQGLADPDTVVISSATYRLVQGYFACQALGEQLLKGVSQPIALYQVLQESGVRSRLEAAGATGLTPLVGRDSEVALLLERWQQSAKGLGQVVMLSGEAGIGKSRLVELVRERVAPQDALRLVWRCSPYHTNSALYPVIDHLQRLLHWRHDEAPTAVLARLEHLVQTSGGAREEMVPLLAALLSLPPPEHYPPLRLSPEVQKHKTLVALVAWLLAEATRQPVLAVWEDLHWADPSTLELLSLLLAQVPTARLLLLLTARPEFQPSWGVRSYLTQLTLTRLGRPQVEAMIRGVTGGKALPPEVVEQIIAKTDGVPLFVEELVKMVLASGLVQESERDYELTGPLPPLAIPATLQDSLMARLDRLASARTVAQLGATLGRDFPYELLRAVAGCDEATLQGGLVQLVDAEVVHQRGLPPQAWYVFKHALIQEAAYQSLLKSTRQQYHQRIALVLEAQFPDLTHTQPEVVAYHYTTAGLGSQALPYWQQAGAHAFARSAHVEAVGHLTQGLALLPILPDANERLARELDLQVLLAPALVATQGPGAAAVEGAYMRAQELCQHVGDTTQLAQVLLGLYRCYTAQAAHRTAGEVAVQLFHLTQPMPDSPQHALAYYAMGVTALYRGEWATARRHLETCQALYDAQPLQVQDVQAGQATPVACRMYGAVTLWGLGYPEQALQRQQEGLTLASHLSHPYSLAYALLMAAILHQFRREAPRLQERAEALMALCTAQGFRTFLVMGTILHGWARTVQGHDEEGIAQIRQGLAAFRNAGEELGRPYFLALLAEGHGTMGQTVEGLHVLAEALALAEKNGECEYEAELYRLKGELLIQEGKEHGVLATEECLQHALASARHQQAKSLELRAAMSLARLWQQQDKRVEARALLAPIYDWFTEGFDTADLQEAKA